MDGFGGVYLTAFPGYAFLYYITMNLTKCRINFTFIAILCTALLSCDFEFWKNSSPVVAEVENSRLHVNELRETMAEGDSPSKEEWVHRIEAWVNSEVMHKEALKKGLHKDPDVQKLIKEAEKKILIDRLRITIGDGTVDVVSDKELQEFYENNKELFRLDSVSYTPFSEVMQQIRGAVLSEKRMNKEEEWLMETKNFYSIEVYPEHLDSL